MNGNSDFAAHYRVPFKPFGKLQPLSRQFGIFACAFWAAAGAVGGNSRQRTVMANLICHWLLVTHDASSPQPVASVPPRV
ncbi:MAG: hypothetical protein KGO48_18270 [Alphaproteobacteria bacterium]|nr:hypothetical protein [Alphaproteobacteria bacterium]